MTTKIIDAGGFSSVPINAILKRYTESLYATARVTFNPQGANPTQSMTNMYTVSTGLYNSMFQGGLYGAGWTDPQYPNHVGLTPLLVPPDGRDRVTSSAETMTKSIELVVSDDADNDQYLTAVRTVVAQPTLVIGNSGQPFGMFTGGDKYFNGNPFPIRCMLQALQLQMSATPVLDYGLLPTGSNKREELTITIISGSQVPSGTYTMTSTDTNAHGRINLGGGEVSIWGGLNDEYKMGQEISIASRDTRLDAILDATGATPGPAETHLTITMTVN
ncbi:MAG: hypothetical protein RSD49_08815 [Hafnia sp.]